MHGKSRGLLVDITITSILGSILGLTTNLPYWFWFSLASGTAVLVLSVPSGVRWRSAQHTTPFLLVISTLSMAGYAASTSTRRSTTFVGHVLGSAAIGPIQIRGHISRLGRFGRIYGRADEALTTIEGRPTWTKVNGPVRIQAIDCELSAMPGQVFEVFGRGQIKNGWREPEVHIDVFDTNHLTIIKETNHWSTTIQHIHLKASKSLRAPPLVPGPANALIGAIVIGQRGINWTTIASPFRATGTAHLLAVSGLHLSMLAGTVLMFMRLGRHDQRWNFVLVIIAVLCMLLAAEVRIPLARAGIMVLCGAIAAMVRWRIPPPSLLSMAAMGIILCDPHVVLRPGFQLSFAVVAALIWIMPIRQQLDPLMISSSWRQMFAVTTVAWFVATPIAVHYFGQFSPLGIPGTVILIPLISTILVLGYVRILVHWIPGLDDVLGVLLDWSASTLWWSVSLLEKLPLAAIRITQPGWFWVILVESCTITAMVSSHHRQRRWAMGGAVGLWVGLWVGIG